MYKFYTDQDNEEFLIHKDTYYQQYLRTLVSVSDLVRPPNERFLELFYASLCDSKVPSGRVLPHSSVYYCRAALEERFPDRKFTIEETKELIKEIYDVSY